MGAKRKSFKSSIITVSRCLGIYLGISVHYTSGVALFFAFVVYCSQRLLFRLQIPRGVWGVV